MHQPRPIFLFTDFSYAGPYVGQLHAAVLGVAPHAVVVDLMHDAPPMRPDLAAYLLAAVCRDLPDGAVVVAVVDPGVGGARNAVVVETARLIAVGPDNGLLSRLPYIRRVARVDWRPVVLSSSFHGRDLFAPVAARIASGQPPALTPCPAQGLVGADWADAVRSVIYIDGFGNAMTAWPAARLTDECRIRLAGRVIAHARTFCEAPPDTPFWYANSQGLLEIAVNGGSAAKILSLAMGDNFLVD